MMKAIVTFSLISLFLLSLPLLSVAHVNGARNTSCYSHLIYHTRFGGQIVQDVNPCETSSFCTEVNFEVVDEVDGNFREMNNPPNHTLYFGRTYKLRLTPSINLGFFIQARIATSPEFMENAKIVGEWNIPPFNSTFKIVPCREYLNSSNLMVYPNSATHSEIFTDLATVPSEIPLYWTAPNAEQDLQIRFFLTIARDFSTLFLPRASDEYRLTNSPTTTPPLPERPAGLTIGSNPAKVYTDRCPSEQDREDTLVDVLQLLSSEFGVVPLGLARSFAASSCEEVASASPQNMAGIYWITNNGTTTQQQCNI